MYTSWRKRKSRLSTLLNVGADEDAQALALDRILHGQSVIGKTSRTTEIDELKFDDKDVDVVGTLEYGQYGVIDVVTCRINGRAYVRKSVEKRFALKTQDQCSPQTERDILLLALKSRTSWAPHLLCAFQSPTHLSLVMDYAQGGTLWDVMESSPHDGRIPEGDVLWWAPQALSAIRWCHSHNFVHRDIKPHNFVLTSDSHLQLIDFGSAAPLLTAANDGSQQVPKRYCLVPCGTCDYISPEILKSHEEALVALEMTDEPELNTSFSDYEPGGYGRETDWWSFGAMLYEMAYGVAPFFASDIRQTYMKIMDHVHSLRFNRKAHVSSKLQDLLRRLLTTSELRLGRQSAQDVMDHAFFDSVSWNTLHEKQPPKDIHLPQFVYSEPPVEPADAASATLSSDESRSRPFSFSALFQSSPMVPEPTISTPQPTPSQKAGRSILRETAVASFIGFSWGPSIDAFSDTEKHKNSPSDQKIKTPRPLKQSTPFPVRTQPGVQATPQRNVFPFMTPVRPNVQTPFHTLVNSTVRRMAQRRPVSDREAMKQLVDCVGMSARKRVLESGRKPRILAALPGSRSSTLKELRFDRSVMVANADGGVSYRVDPSSTSASGSAAASSGVGVSASLSSVSNGLWGSAEHDDFEEESSGVTEMSYSPTPRPRPSSVQSLASRSRTPSSSSVASLLSRGPTGNASGGNKSTTEQGETYNQSLDKTQNQSQHAKSVTVLSPVLAVAEDLPPDRRADANTEAVNALSVQGNLSDELDALETRYKTLMRDIGYITARLNAMSSQVNGHD